MKRLRINGRTEAGLYTKFQLNKDFHLQSFIRQVKMNLGYTHYMDNL